MNRQQPDTCLAPVMELEFLSKQNCQFLPQTVSQDCTQMSNSSWHSHYFRALVLKSIMEAFLHLRKTSPCVLHCIFVLLTHNQINSVVIKPRDEKKHKNPPASFSPSSCWRSALPESFTKFQLLHMQLRIISLGVSVCCFSLKQIKWSQNKPGCSHLK